MIVHNKHSVRPVGGLVDQRNVVIATHDSRGESMDVCLPRPHWLPNSPILVPHLIPWHE